MGFFDKLFGSPAPEPPPEEPAENGAVNGKVLHLRSALVQAFGEQVEKLASMPAVNGFVEAHLRDDELKTRVLDSAEERMNQTLEGGDALHVKYREHETLLVQIDVLPVAAKDASEWFTKQYGSYLTFQNRVVEDPEFQKDGYKVFVHVVFGPAKRLKGGLFFAWSSIGIMPVWEPNVSEWVCPRVCCNEDDRAILGF